MRVTVHLQRR
jgi:hypothetical protein